MKRALAVLILLLAAGAAKAQAHSVSLTCTASTSTGVTGYNFYRSTTSGSGYTKLTASPVATCSWTDTTVLGNTTYFYVATAVCPTCSPSESANSNQVAAVVPPDPQPNPPTNLTVTSIAMLKNSDGTVTVTAQYQDVPNRTTRFQISQVYPYKVVKSGSLANSSGTYTVSFVGPLSGRAYIGVCDSTGKCASAYSQ